ncbi:GNAT family N-acetyltransferase [Marinoscillum luteum]|uniref:GNAT family N-acetyltransferase n=1 Tax=Marinoscillum luteum TaxID=861051 RepID=A0ABW7N8Z8_9BACT
MKLRMVIAEEKNDLDRALKIRSEVFVKEQGIPPHLDHDADDATSIHLLAYADKELIGTGRLTEVPASGWQLARIAVIKSYRGLGIGRMIIENLENIARSKNARRVFLRPHKHLQSFYEQLGYQLMNDEVIRIQSFELVIMEKHLN